MSSSNTDTIVQGASFAGADPDTLKTVLDAAFEYRGDVTLIRRDGTEITGFLFDRRSEITIEQSLVRILEPTASVPLNVPYSQIAEVRFSGRDTAAGKSWENWVRRYAEKKIAGENTENDS